MFVAIAVTLAVATPQASALVADLG